MRTRRAGRAVPTIGLPASSDHPRSATLEDLDAGRRSPIRVGGEADRRAAPPEQIRPAENGLATPGEVPRLVQLNRHPAGEPGEEVLGRVTRVEVRRQVVERGEDRGERVVECLGEAHRERVFLLEDRGQARCHGMRAGEPVDEATHQPASTSTWCS